MIVLIIQLIFRDPITNFLQHRLRVISKNLIKMFNFNLGFHVIRQAPHDSSEVAFRNSD